MTSKQTVHIIIFFCTTWKSSDLKGNACKNRHVNQKKNHYNNLCELCWKKFDTNL